MQMTELEFLEKLREYVTLDVTEAWHQFCKDGLPHNVLPGKGPGERRDFFKAKLEQYRELPVTLIADIRKARTEEFKRDLGKAFLTQPDITEQDVEDWCGALGRVQQHERNIPDALELLAEKQPETAAELTARAKELWPGFYPEPTE